MYSWIDKIKWKTSNFIHEIIRSYKNLLNLQSQQANFYDFIRPVYIGQIIQEATFKLPTNQLILPTPLLKTRIKINQNNIFVYEYILRHNRKIVELLKVTAVLIRIDEEFNHSRL